jgi:hypothetical protein
LRDSYAKFEAHGIKLYAISYDDQETLREFAQKQNIPYPLLSDLDSEVIQQYGILNTEVTRDDGPLYGTPFPGVYVADESGRVVAKFFHDTYKKRDSPETLIDAALGRIVIAEDAPRAEGGGDDIKITAAVHGGSGSIRQGIMRKLVVRFELGEGLHIYGESVGVDLEVWGGTVDIVVPFYAKGELASETRPLDAENIDIEVRVRYQACTDTECLLPLRTLRPPFSGLTPAS